MLTTGSNNILIGTNALANNSAADTSNWLNIGNTVYGDFMNRRLLLTASATAAVTALAGHNPRSGRSDGNRVQQRTVAWKDGIRNALRPTSPVVGMLRYNTTTAKVEAYHR